MNEELIEERLLNIRALTGQEESEKVSAMPLYQLTNGETHNQDTHVQVRILCSYDLPVDFATGVVLTQNKQDEQR